MHQYVGILGDPRHTKKSPKNYVCTASTISQKVGMTSFFVRSFHIHVVSSMNCRMSLELLGRNNF